MTEHIIIVLGGIVVAFTSGVVGKYIGSRGKVENNLCLERRISCAKLIIEKIDHLTKKVDAICKVLEDRHA